MKTLIHIVAHTYQGDRIATPERTYTFTRPASAQAPTYTGAARMVAKEAACKPSDVSVTRVEAMCYECK